MSEFLNSFGALSLLTCVVACGIFVPWAIAPLALWFVLSVIWNYRQLCQEKPKS